MRPFWTGPLVLLTQAALLVIFGRIFSPGVSPRIWWILMIALALLCAAADAILFFTLRRLAQKEQTEERERLLAESLADQEKRAREWEESEKQAAAVRREMLAQLKGAREALAARRAADARAGMTRAVDSLRPSLTRFCDHPVADALFAAKQKEAEQCGVAFSCAAGIPRELALGEAVLCAVLSNLLDNALRAAASAQGSVAVRARTDRGFLVVRVENDAPPAPAPRRAHAFEEHGWGLSIVESLARTHDGRLEITRLPGRFCATVWLAAH